jgi:glycosyltransferase involved in cell wall biosynthesis
MKLLHVVPSFYPAVCYGGPIHSVLNLCLSLRKLGCEIRVLTTDANGDRRLTQTQQKDAAIQPLQVQFCRRLGDGMIAPRLLQRLSVEGAWADVIHLTAVYNFSTWPTLLAARFRRKPLVWSPRGTLQRWQGSRSIAAKAAWETVCRFLSPRRVALHVTSEQEAAESSDRLGNLGSWVIPNGIDVPPIPPPSPKDDRLRLLFIGRLDPKKGLENLISAVSLLLKCRSSNSCLKIVGNGDPKYVASLQRLVAEAGIGNQIDFCGHLDGEQKYQAFAGCDVVVVPSHTENFGMVVAEALAHARPVIVSRGTPWSEVEKRRCGLWVENDPASLASAIQQIYSADRLAMGLRGREWMVSDFSWHEQARRMIELYEHMMRA